MVGFSLSLRTGILAATGSATVSLIKTWCREKRKETEKTSSSIA